MTVETLDETLDRVAREITAVPPDATFGARLRPRLDGSESDGFGLKAVAAAACILALAIAAALVRSGDFETRPVAAVARSTNDGIAAPAKATPTASEVSEVLEPSPGTAAATIRPPAAASARRVLEHTTTVSTIPALSEPRVLDVAHLQLEPLVLLPVDVSSLEIAELQVSDLGGAEDPKE